MTSITLPRYKTPHGIAYSHVVDVSDATDVSVANQQESKAVPVVLIHGVGLRSECWYQQVDALKSDYSVFTFDMPGHGESELLTQKVPNLSDFTQALATFIKEVVKAPAVIIGHSMGGLLALSLSNKYPELCLALVPMNTVYKRSSAAKEAVKARANNLKNLSQADACAPIARWFSDSPSAKDKLHAQLCRDWLSIANLEGYAAAYKVFAEEDGPETQSISDLDIPVLYLTGELDLNSSVAMSKAMADITPNAEYQWVKDSRHMTPLTHADEVNAAILSFLERRLLKKSQ